MAVEKLKDLAQSTQDFFASHILNWSPASNRRRSPIEILKRLQREAFSDLMKLRERQEKAERVLSFYKTAKVGPFQEGGTRVRGEIDVLGALAMTNTVDQQACDAIQRTGIASGVESRLWFETDVGERDRLVTEFVGGHRGGLEGGAPLSLAKVLYSANVSEWLSALAIPVGARCRDFGVDGATLPQEKALTEYSAIGPPLLNDLNGSAIGMVARKSNFVASLAQFASVVESPPPLPPPPQPTSPTTAFCFSTFAQVAYQLTTNTKLSLSGIRKGAKRSNQQTTRLGPMTFPIGIFARRERSSPGEEEAEEGGADVDGSMALAIESRLDESTRLGSWLEVKGKLQDRNVKWAVAMADTPEDGFGWGLSLGGSVRDPRNREHFQVEAFLNWNLGKKGRIQPAVVYMRDGAAHFPTLMLRSSFSL